MSQELDAGQLEALQAVVEQLKVDPTIVYDPKLQFFKDFLDSWGAKVPAASKAKAPPAPGDSSDGPKKVDPTPPEPVVEEEEEEEEEPEEPEEPDPERLPEDPEPYPEQGPSGELELTDEQMDAQAAAKQAAVEAIEDGDLAKALEKYTEAFKIGNVSAMMYAKRAELLLKLKRPNACIADCTAAIAVNPDSAKAYRTRGKAHRKLGHWKEAHEDIALGQKLDYDDDLVDIQKFVDDKWKKIAERETRRRLRDERIAKKKKEADMKRRKEEAKKAYEEAKAAESASGGGFPGFPGIFSAAMTGGSIHHASLIAWPMSCDGGGPWRCGARAGHRSLSTKPRDLRLRDA